MQRYACENTAIKLDANPAWQAVSWTSVHRGDLGSLPSINYLVQQADTVFAIGQDAQGCKIRQVTAITLSVPQITVAADKYKIVRGTEVLLQASGAEHYVWTPSMGLDRADIANPVARPVETTEYHVTGYDSLDCSAQTQITITVEGSMFIPNLFTPNGDGRNDQLKVYGLASVTDFSLTISNREGSVVFRTTDIVEASTSGWDGTDHGVKQPGGVYFWKVKGRTVDGSKLLLNGKESGSIVLIQ
jgi:gliding motility-associated-like protein